MESKVSLYEILEYIRDNGVSLGNRWLIREEGTRSCEALVFRDAVTESDTRYLCAGKHVKL